MEYPNGVREILYEDRFRQAIDFTRMTWGKIAPTDFDLVLDFKNKVWVFCEYKCIGADFPRGQSLALEHIVEALTSAGIHAIAILVEHDTSTKEMVDASAGNVKYVYYSEVSNPFARDMADKWVKNNTPRSVESVINGYIRYTMGDDFLQSVIDGTYRRN